MKGDKHHIDSLFEDSLGELKVEPREFSWNTITNELDALQMAQARRRTIIRWTSFSAAMIAITAYLFVKSCSVIGLPHVYQFSSRIQLKENSVILFSKTDKKDIGILNTNEVAISTISQKFSGQNKKRKEIIENQKFSKNSDIINTSNSTFNNNENNSDNSNLEIAELNSMEVVKKDNDVVIAENYKNSKLDIDNNNPTSNEPSEVNQETQLLPSLSELVKNIEPSNQNLTLDTVQKDFNSVNSPLPGPRLATGWNIEFGIGPVFVSNNLPVNTNIDKPIVQTNTKDLYPTGEILLHLKYNLSNFYIKSGIQISEFGNNSLFDITNEMHDTSGGYASWNMNRYWTYDTIGYFEDPFVVSLVHPILQPTYHIDTVSSQWNSRDEIYYTQSKAESVNKYRYIEIPIILGYQHQFKRLNVFAGAGLGYGLMINTTGKYISDNNLLDNTSNLNPYNKFNINYMLNTGLGYAISNNWNLFLQGSFKSNLTSIYKYEYIADAKFHSYGFQFGVSYNIK